jgi:hypothetical protein
VIRNARFVKKVKNSFGFVSNNDRVLVFITYKPRKFCRQWSVMADNLSLTAEQTEKILQFQVMKLKLHKWPCHPSAVLTRAE